MPIAVSINRPKLATTTTLNENIDFDPAVLVSDEIEIRVFLDNITIDPLAIVDLSVDPITWAAAGTTITGVAGSFSSVKEGDVITSTSGTDFANTQTVSSVNVDGSIVTFAPAADGNTDSGNGASTLTITPGDLDTTLYYVRLKNAVSGTNLTVTPRISCFDGTLVAEGGTADDSDDVVFADGTIKNLTPSVINLDTYLTNARVARTN